MSGPVTDSSGQIVKRGSQEPKVVQLLMKMKDQIALALPKHVTPDRITRVALTALRNNSGLTRCTVPSVLGSIMQASQLGLEVNTPLGMAYLIPYKVKGVDTCQLIIGYQGYMELARRSGLVTTPMADVVREGDIFEVTYGLTRDIKHSPSKDENREKKKITHAYAYVHAIPKESAPPIFVVLTRAQVLARRDRSAAVKSGRTSPWNTDEEAMFCKTAIRALWRYLPKTVEMATAGDLEDRADRGASQSAAWDPEIVDAMANEGIVVDTTGEDVTEDGEIIEGQPQDQQQASQPETPPARNSEPNPPNRNTGVPQGPPPPPPERKRMREPGDD